MAGRFIATEAVSAYVRDMVTVLPVLFEICATPLFMSAVKFAGKP